MSINGINSRNYEVPYVQFMNHLQEENPEGYGAFSPLLKIPPLFSALLPPHNDSSDSFSTSHEKRERHYCVLCKKEKAVLNWHLISSDPDVYHCGRCHSKINPIRPLKTRHCVRCNATKTLVRWHPISSNPGTYCCGTCNDQRRVKRVRDRKYCVICKELRACVRWEKSFHEKAVADVCGRCADQRRSGRLREPVLPEDILDSNV